MGCYITHKVSNNDNVKHKCIPEKNKGSPDSAKVTNIEEIILYSVYIFTSSYWYTDKNKLVGRTTLFHLMHLHSVTQSNAMSVFFIHILL